MPTDLLTDHHIVLCRAVARRMTRGVPWLFDEAHSESFVGLARAVMKYEPDCPLDFTRFAYWKIRDEIREFLRYEKPRGRVSPCGGHAPRRFVAFEKPGRLPSSLPWDAHDRIASDSLEVGWEIESEDFVRDAMSYLSPRLREVIRLRYLCAETQSLDACAARLGITKNYVNTLERRALAAMRARFSPGGNGTNPPPSPEDAP